MNLFSKLFELKQIKEGEIRGIKADLDEE